MIKKGAKSIVDVYKGTQLIEKVYKGAQLIFDPYTTLTGTLPLTFNSRVAGALKNYRIYGTSAGSGTPTESGEPAGYKIPILLEIGNLFSEAGSGLVQIRPDGTKGFGKSMGNLPVGDYAISYTRAPTGLNLFITKRDSNNNYYDSLANPASFSVLSTDVEVIVRTSSQNEDTTWAENGFTDIVVNQQSNYDLMIGSSKLGEDEYVDYQEQKVYKLKEVHKDTVTINGIEWDILGYNHDTVYKSDNTLAQHSVTIQTHDCISELQFDAKEALFAFPEGLAAGTYHFTVSQQPWYEGDVGKIMQFTLANAIPADGVIVLGNAYNATMIGSTISVYASCSATTATETATISEGSDGTDLGSVGNAISGNTNSIQRALVGNNNYNESAIRQYLNSDSEAGTYWTPQNKWDRPPSWNGSTAGFLRGFNSDFVSAIGKASKRTAKNTVSDGGGYIDTEEKVFLLSRTEVYAGTNNSINEGTAYKYYLDYSDLSSAGTGADSNRIKYRNNVAKYWWLRSPVTGGANYPFYTSPSGAVISGYYVTNIIGVTPACCIVLDDIDTNTYLQSLFYKPTDPPVPLPAIQTYKGENTLSSTETVGEVSVKGRISEVQNG